jgi:hypothetical protein
VLRALTEPHAHSLIAIQEADASTDFGTDGAFFADKDTCAEHTDKDYTYKLCFFNRVTQDKRGGGGSTTLGKWKRWENDKPVMVFEGASGAASLRSLKRARIADGDRCHNGPARSVRVSTECGSAVKLASVAEPSRCVYAMVLSTPAACTGAPGSTASVDVEQRQQQQSASPPSSSGDAAFPYPAQYAAPPQHTEL